MSQFNNIVAIDLGLCHRYLKYESTAKYNVSNSLIKSLFSVTNS